MRGKSQCLYSSTVMVFCLRSERILIAGRRYRSNSSGMPGGMVRVGSRVRVGERECEMLVDFEM
jgi:hypothetical protein